MLSAILATTHSPSHSSSLVISDILAWKNINSLFTASLPCSTLLMYHGLLFLSCTPPRRRWTI